MDLTDFLKCLDRTIDISDIFLQYGCTTQQSAVLLVDQIQDLANEYYKVDRLLESIKLE